MQLHKAAGLGDAVEVARLLDAGADPNAVNEEGFTALHIAAAHGHMHIISVLLAAGTLPTLPDPRGTLPIHIAVSGGHPAAARLLLQAAPATATAVGMLGLTPLLVAAQRGQEEMVGLLLEAAPDAALARTSTGPSPLWMACALGHTAVARQLLAAAPQTATMLAGISTTPLHAAVEQGHLDIVQLILQVQPLAATVVSRQGSLALHLAASANHPCSAAMVRLLLAAAPGTAAAVRVPADATLLPYTALHLAAIEGNAAAARLLVQAAPQVCLMQVGPQSDLPPESVWPLDSELPLQTALSMAAAAQHHQQGAPSGPPSRLKPVAAYLDTANAMLAAMPPDTSLPLLARFADVALPLFPTIAAHWPLTAAQWQQVPTPSPGLGSALPATLQRSEAEAALLVARLPAADAARLRAFALALHGTQQQLDSVLPAHISARILSLFDA